MFYTAIPGREYDTLRLGKSRQSKDGQKGIVSSISFRHKADMGCANVFAVGTYAGSIYIYDDRIPSSVAADIVIQGSCVVGHGKNRNRFREKKLKDLEEESIVTVAKSKWFDKTASGGITQLTWSHDDNYLFSAARRSNQIICWDIRCLSSQEYVPMRGVMSYERCGETNQRIGFDIHKDIIFVGSCDNEIKVYDVKSGICESKIKYDDIINDVSYCANYGLLVASTGGRRFNFYDSSDEEEANYFRYMDTPGVLQIYQHKIFH